MQGDSSFRGSAKESQIIQVDFQCAVNRRWVLAFVLGRSSCGWAALFGFRAFRREALEVTLQ